MNRIGNTAENSIVTTLLGIRRGLDALINAQRMNAKNVDSFLAVGPTKTYTLANTATTGLRVGFTADHQDYPFATLSYNVYLGTTATEIHPGMAGYPLFRVYESKALPNYSEWSMFIQNNSGSTQTILIVPTVLSTDTGTISTL